MQEHVCPNEQRYYREAEELGPWAVYPVVEELEPKARVAGLWNLFLPASEHGAGLSNFDYAPLCEIMGRSHLAPEVFNCSAPDTGNMEVLARYGTPEQQEKWLKPLLAGEIRSCFAMTEPKVASSDATNIESSIVRDGDDYVINGHKWYTTNATDPRCRIAIFMGKSDPDNPDRYKQQSMILVPMDTPGVKVVRPIGVFGFYGVPDRASEVVFENVRVLASNTLLGEGRGFEIAMIKVAAPNMACKVSDWAIQAYGGGGTNNDVGLASAYATARLLRLADGPDEVHRQQIGRLELAKYK